MAVKNFWSFNPGETIVAEELQKKLKDKAELFFPVKDTGIDLLVVTKSSRNLLSFQIKESRYYEDGNSSWHQETKINFDKNKDRVDFYIFVIYLPGYLVPNKKKNAFIIRYVIVPTKILLGKITYKKSNKNGTYDFYFSFNRQDKLSEVRERKEMIQNNLSIFDYTEFLDNWDLITQRIK